VSGVPATAAAATTTGHASYAPACVNHRQNAGEALPHVHVRMVARYLEVPRGLKAWGVFDVHRLAAAGEITVGPREVSRLVEAYRAALAVDPPPAPSIASTSEGEPR
jgi:hypothetical protein